MRNEDLVAVTPDTLVQTVVKPFFGNRLQLCFTAVAGDLT